MDARIDFDGTGMSRAPFMSLMATQEAGER
jgi:hypothetical protein